MDWIYGQIVGFLGNFFALMGNMGVELFELEWVSAIILFFSRLAWALFAVSVVVCAFECGIEYSTGRGNLQQCGMNIIKGFLAVSLFTVVPVRLYALSVSLQGTFSAGLTGYGRSIGEVGQDIITELKEIQTLADVVNSSHFGLGIITSPIPGESMSLGDIDRAMEGLGQQFNDLLREAADANNADSYTAQFQSISTAMAEFKRRKAKILQIRQEQEQTNRRVQAVASVLKTVSSELTEWDDNVIYQLLEKVTVLSREHIRVTLRDGLEIEQAVEQPIRRKFA